MPSDAPVLALTGVHKTYNDGTPLRAVQGATLTVARDEFVAVKGPSGCGKTTLLRLIAGLEPADGGEIVVAGVSVTGSSEAALVALRRTKVGLLASDPQLLAGLSLVDNVALPAVVAGANRDVAQARAYELLDLVGLADLWRVAPDALTPIDRQQAALARALTNRPPLLLADEPSGRLDSAGRRQLLDLLGRVHAAGQAILLATHDDDVAAAATRLVTMRDGRLDELPSPGLVPTSEPAGRGRAVL